jgi:hypothetical protein
LATAGATPHLETWPCSREPLRPSQWPEEVLDDQPYPQFTFASGDGRDPAAGARFYEGVLTLERRLARYAGPNLVGYPYRDDAKIARELGALHRLVIRAVLADRTISEWVLTAGATRYTIAPSTPRPSEAALRAAKYCALFDWTNFALVQPHLRGRYTNSTTTELPRRWGEVVSLPYRDQRGVILSGSRTYKFNDMEAKRAGIRLGQRVSFIPRRIGTTEIAGDIQPQALANSRRAA